MNVEELRENDMVEYTSVNSDGVEIFVTNDVEALGRIIQENKLEDVVGEVAYQDAVNTCSSCGVLYYVEDLVQLEDDIICEKCNN